MRLHKQETNGCTYAALAMVLNLQPEAVYAIFRHWNYKDNHPFTGEWENVPRVPSMEEICDLALRHCKTAFVPFPFDPIAFPHEDCKPIHVWDEPQKKFEGQLGFGRGLIEGLLSNGRGHMVAWDGHVVYDPRGYCYSINVADKFNFTPRRFWLAVPIK